MPHSFTLPHKSLWIKWEKPPDWNEDFILENPFFGVDLLTVYQVDRDGALLSQQKSGDRHPFSQRQISYRYPAFPIHLREGTQTVFVRMQGNEPLVSQLRAWSEREFLKHSQVNTVIVSLCIGGLLTLMLYNFSIYITTHDKAYRYYCYYMLAINVFVSILTGMHFYLDFQDSVNTWLTNSGIFVAINLILISTCLFCEHSLDLKQKAKKIIKWLHLLSGLSGCLFLGHLFFESVILILATLLNTIFVCLLVFSIGAFLCLQRVKIAYIFTFSRAMLIVSSLNLALSYLGIFKYQAHDIVGMLAGSLLEGVFLSLALGFKLADADRQRRNQQKALLLQSELRIRMARAVAHGINNPLNYISTGLELIRTCIADLRQTTEALLGKEPSEDQDIRLIQNRYKGIFNGGDIAISQIQDGLHRAGNEVAEIRALHLADGLLMSSFAIPEMNQLIQKSLMEMMKPKDFSRLIFLEEDSVTEKANLYGNIYLLKHCMELIIATVSDQWRVPIEIYWQPETQGDVIMIMRPLGKPTSLDLGSLEVFVNTLLTPLNVKVNFFVAKNHLATRIPSCSHVA